MTTVFRRHPEQYQEKSRFARYSQYFRDVGPLYIVTKPTSRLCGLDLRLVGWFKDTIVTSLGKEMKEMRGKEGGALGACTDRCPDPQKAKATTAAALNASESLLSQALRFSCLGRMPMPAPELARTFAYGPCESHDVCEPRVTGQYSTIFKVAARPSRRNLLTSANHMCIDAGVPLVAEDAVANGCSGWLDVKVS